MTRGEQELADGGLELVCSEQVVCELGGARGLVCTKVLEFCARGSGVELAQLRLGALEKD